MKNHPSFSTANRPGLKSKGYNEAVYHCKGIFESSLLSVALGRVGMRMLAIAIFEKDEFCEECSLLWLIKSHGLG